MKLIKVLVLPVALVACWFLFFWAGVQYDLFVNDGWLLGAFKNFHWYEALSSRHCMTYLYVCHTSLWTFFTLALATFLGLLSSWRIGLLSR
ncbi:MAG: hypothetical protein WCT25_00345 [Candidatus Paceibacterota bacterium]|jgi:hypothetical protein